MERLTVKNLEEMENSVLSPIEVSMALGITRNTFYKKHSELEKKFPIDRIGKKYVIRKEPFIAYLKAEGYDKYG